MQNSRRWRNADHPRNPQTGRRLAPRPLPQDRKPALYGVGHRGHRRIRPVRTSRYLRLLTTANRTATSCATRRCVSSLALQEEPTLIRSTAATTTSASSSGPASSSSDHYVFHSRASPTARGFAKAVGQEPALAGLRRSLRAAAAHTRLIRFPVRSGQGKRVRSTTHARPTARKEQSP